MAVSGIDLGKYKLGWHDTEQFEITPKKGLNEQTVRDISAFWHANRMHVMRVPQAA